MLLSLLEEFLEEHHFLTDTLQWSLIFYSQGFQVVASK